ncbi:YccF domain-containing protein [Myceligenerans xiligouense]|nr:YccF domain-containing protein [Myceligenerans xiligouense]
MFRTLLNIIWLVFAGLGLFLGYALAGIICCLLIVTIPFGIASFRIAVYSLWPFGRAVVDKQQTGVGEVMSLVGNVIWVIVAGWWLAIGHILTAIPLFISIIGIPMGWANLKLIPVSLMPLGKEIVPSDSLLPTYQRSA